MTTPNKKKTKNSFLYTRGALSTLVLVEDNERFWGGGHPFFSLVKGNIKREMLLAAAAAAVTQYSKTNGALILCRSKIKNASK